MLADLEDLRRRLDSARQLASVARAMKWLAAVRIRQARAAVDAMAEYASTVELGLQAILAHHPIAAEPAAAADRTAMVVFGSDLGLVGAYNIKIVDHAHEVMTSEGATGPHGVMLVVGGRAADLLEQDGWAIHRRFDAPESVTAVTETVQALLVEIERLGPGTEIGRVLLAYNAYHAGATYRPHTAQLFPVNVEWLRGLARHEWPSRCIPWFRPEPETLFTDVVREYLFVSLFRAAAESHASEHAGRLAAMQASERRIDEHVRDLRSRFDQGRTQRITEELLDLMTGYRAITGR